MKKPFYYIIFLLLSVTFTESHQIHASCMFTCNNLSADTVCRWQPVGTAAIPTYIITGKGEGSGRIDRIAFHPSDSNTIYVATPGGGLWKTTNYAEKWIPLTDHLPVTGIADMAISKNDPGKLWIATGDAFTQWSYSDGIYFSTDGGINWNSTSFYTVPSDTGIRIHRITINPQNDSSIFAGTSDGLFHSADAGISFNKIIAGVVRDIEWLNGDSSVLLFTRADPAGQTMICRSLDGGITPDTVFQTTEPINRIEISAAQGIAYALMIDPGGNLSGVYRCDTDGNNWVKTAGSKPNITGWTCEGSDNRGAGIDILSLAVNPWNTNEIYAGSNYLWKSTDGGQTWKAVSGWCGGGIPYVRPYHRALAFGPDKKIYTGSGGGIFRSADAGKTWINISGNLFIMPITAFSVPADTGFLVTGTLENGTIRIKNDKWEFIADGDGFSPLVFDSLNFFIQVREALTQSIKLLKTADGGYNYRTCTPAGAGGNIYSRVVSYPEQDEILYFSYGSFFRSTDAGLIWEIIAERGDDYSFQFLEQSILKPNIWYGANQDHVWRSADGGYEWEEILNCDSLPVSTGNINAICISRSNPELVWVGFAKGGVIQTDDGGQTWEDISQGLPVLMVYSLEYDHTRQLLFAGTQQGVFVRNHKNEWSVYGSDLPHTRITCLQMDIEHSLVYAGTLGRGIWRAPVIALDDQPVPDFELSSYITCGGSSTIITGSATGMVSVSQWDFGDGALPADATGMGPHEVSYQTPGFKTIRLVINDSIEIVKKNLVEVVTSIKVEVLAEKICTVDTVSIIAFGADEYEWNPAKGLISDNEKGSVILFPHGVVTYVVKGTMGNCVAYDTVVIATISDEINQAFPLVTGMNGPFTNECATKAPSDPIIPTGSTGDGCNSQDGWCKKRSLTNTVWFSFVIPESGSVGIEAPGDFNNQMAFFLLDPLNDSLIFLAANDDYFGLEGNNAAAITGVSGLEPGTTGIIMIDGGGSGESGEFNLVLRNNPLNYKPLSDNNIQFYPNPASNLIWITGIRKDCQYQIISMDGKILKTGLLRQNGETDSMQLELPPVDNQMAIVKFTNDEGIRVLKLIIEKK